MEKQQKTMDAVAVLRRLNQQDREQTSQLRRSTEMAKSNSARGAASTACEKEGCAIESPGSEK